MWAGVAQDFDEVVEVELGEGGWSGSSGGVAAVGVHAAVDVGVDVELADVAVERRG